MKVREVIREIERDGWYFVRQRGSHRQYLVLLEAGPSGFSAYSPDLPGCVAAADTPEETQRLMREAIELHLEELRAGGGPVPEPATSAVYVEV